MSGSSEDILQQISTTRTLCTAVKNTTAVAGVSVDGYTRQYLEVVAVGTVAAQAVSLQFEGSYDNANWYIAGTQQVDATASPARAAANFTLTPGNGTIRRVYQVLDTYPYLRINPTANSLSGTGAGLTVTGYLVPS